MTLSVLIKPMEEGVYKLEIRNSTDRPKSVKFTSPKSRVVAIDPRKCSPGITLSNNNMTATKTCTDDDWRSAVARDGYTTGKHSWNVRICNTTFGLSTPALGVTDLPPNNEDSQAVFFFNSQYLEYQRFFPC